MDFIPHDQINIKKMLKTIGVREIDDLFQDIPKELCLDKLNLPSSLSEPDLLRKLAEIANNNKLYSSSFLGAG
ncbi:MAG: glycine dehydrogenase, partial [Promethearchaeota archaeon]